MPMERPPPEDCSHDLFRAEYTNKYLESYVDKPLPDGSTLRARIRFHTYVRSITKTDDYWYLSCAIHSRDAVISTRKLMVANGDESIPNMPGLPGAENFTGTILHSLDFGRSDILHNNDIRHVSVIGAGKSSADMVYGATKTGKTVSWIIPKSGEGGRGPAFFVHADTHPGYENTGFAAQTRVMASLQPTLWNAGTWWTRFICGTRLGVSIVRLMFSKIDAMIRKRAGYCERDSSKGFSKLEYETE